MNRKLALAASVSGAVALVSGAVMLSTLLSVGPPRHPLPDLAAAPATGDGAASTSLDPVVVYQDEYEYVVTGEAAPATPGPGPSNEAAGPSAAPSAGAASGAPAPTTAAVAPTPAPVAPGPSTTTTTRPPGVPADWPADKPIPPMPSDCREPQLEDNGVWNCQH